MAEVAATLDANPAGSNNRLLFTAVEKGVAGNFIAVTYVAPSTPTNFAIAVDGNEIVVTLGVGLYAVLSTALTGNNNDLDYTAVHVGAAGNSITIAYIDPAAESAVESVVVAGTDIVFHLATDTGTAASGTLTSDNTNVANNDTVTIGTTVYTFKTTLTPAAGEVLRGADADASLLNLIRAINHTGTPGTDYASATVIDPNVTAASAVTAHAFLVTAKVKGVGGNALASTETSAHLSWGAATLAGGAHGAITSTGDSIKATLLASAQASSLVTAADKSANDGSGVVTALAATNLASGSDSGGATTADDFKTALVASVAASRLVTAADTGGDDGSASLAALARTQLTGGTDATNGYDDAASAIADAWRHYTSTDDEGNITYVGVTLVAGCAVSVASATTNGRLQAEKDYENHLAKHGRPRVRF